MREILGLRIAAVRYLVPRGVQWSDEYRRERAHEVDHGVQLVAEDGRIVSLMWKMAGEEEFLNITLGEPGTGEPGALIEAVDVSDLPEWAPILGREVVGLGIDRQSVWAMRFSMSDGSSFAVALGELRDGSPTYMPTSVVVLFGKREIDSYRIPASTVSAWGEDV